MPTHPCPSCGAVHEIATTPGPAPTPTPTPTGKGMWADISALPTTGAAWDKVKAEAAKFTGGTPDLENQDGTHDTTTLAAAYVAARLSDSGLKFRVKSTLNGLPSAPTGRVLAMARQLPSYLVACDVLGIVPPNLKNLLTVPAEGHGGGNDLVSTARLSTNNWGTHARAAVAGIAVLTKDAALLADVAKWHARWCGEDNGHTMKWNATRWHTAPDKAGINPTDGWSGVLPEDQRRGGEPSGTTIPPQNYVKGGLGGALICHVILVRAGAVSLDIADNAMRRAYMTYGPVMAWDGDDGWQIPIVTKLFGLNLRGDASAVGKPMAHTAWTHG